MSVLTSSKFSFMDFNPEPVAENDAHVLMPVVNTFAQKFQVRYHKYIVGDPLYTDLDPWAAPIYNGTPIVSAKTKLRRTCGRLIFPIPFSAYPITIASTGNVPSLDDNTYNAPSDVLTNLISKGEFDWKMDDYHIYADSCCIPIYDGTINVTGADSYAYNNKYEMDYVYYYGEIPTVSMSSIIPVGECFAYGIFSEDPELTPSSLTNVSNAFKRYNPSCFLTYTEYWNNKNAFDFNYGCDVKNSTWLPAYFTNPNNPTKESIYVESTGNRRVLSASLDEEYLFITDRLTQWFHRKIEGMLLHDHKVFTNTYYEIVAEELMKNTPYEKDWDNDVHIPTAIGKTKLIKNLSYINGNCCEEELDCCDPVICAQLIDLEMESYRDGSNWGVEISKCFYSVPPSLGTIQTVEIFYRERYSVGAYTSAGTTTFTANGNIAAPPNPFLITGLPDSWQEVEIKAVNACGSNDLIVYINNPCETMTGFIGNTVDNGTSWELDITNVVYSNWPTFGVHKTITVSYREEGSGSGWTSAGTFDVVVNVGYVLTMTPNPFVISGLDPDWEKVELKIEYGCEKTLFQIFSTPMGDCTAVSSVLIVDIESTTASATWPPVSPTPSGLYDWELWDFAMTTMIDSGTGYWNPGTLVLGLFGLTPDTHYNFRVKSNCGGSSSVWTEKDFTTLP